MVKQPPETRRLEFPCSGHHPSGLWGLDRDRVNRRRGQRTPPARVRNGSKPCAPTRSAGSSMASASRCRAQARPDPAGSEASPSTSADKLRSALQPGSDARQRSRNLSRRPKPVSAFRASGAPFTGMRNTLRERAPPQHPRHAIRFFLRRIAPDAAPVAHTHIGSDQGFQSGCRDSNPGPLDPQLPPNHPATSQHVSREIRDQDFRERPQGRCLPTSHYVS